MTRLAQAELRQFLLTATQEEIRAYWVWLQRDKRDKGEPHYTALVDSVTDHIYVTI